MSDISFQKWASASPSWMTTQGVDLNGIVLSSRVRLARNVDGIPFPHNNPPAAAKKVLQGVFQAAKSMPELKSSHSLFLSALDPIEKNFLVERHIISHEHAQEGGERGLIVGPGETISIMVNEEDHLRIACFEPGLALQKANVAMTNLETQLEELIPISFDKEFGFITACPTNLGSGLRASALVHLPALSITNRIEELINQAQRNGLVLRGFYGEGTQPLGHIYQISNAQTMAISEDDTIKKVEKIVHLIAQEEKIAQAYLSQRPLRLQTEDMVGRSLGTLQSARLLKLNEGMIHISNLRLGAMLGFKLPVLLEVVTNLIFLIQPAHLRLRKGSEFSGKSDESLRAEYIRTRLKV